MIHNFNYSNSLEIADCLFGKWAIRLDILSVYWHRYHIDSLNYICLFKQMDYRIYPSFSKGWLPDVLRFFFLHLFLCVLALYAEYGLLHSVDNRWSSAKAFSKNARKQCPNISNKYWYIIFAAEETVLSELLWFKAILLRKNLWVRERSTQWKTQSQRLSWPSRRRFESLAIWSPGLTLERWQAHENIYNSRRCCY